ncbi:hypothetical protein KI387_006027, partial [Taxus chinensis]
NCVRHLLEDSEKVERLKKLSKFIISSNTTGAHYENVLNILVSGKMLKDAHIMVK